MPLGSASGAVGDIPSGLRKILPGFLFFGSSRMISYEPHLDALFEGSAMTLCLLARCRIPPRWEKSTGAPLLERVAELEPHQVITGGQLNIWIRERREAGQNAARFAKLAIDAGVNERQVRIAEQLGSIIGQLLYDVFAELDLTSAQHARAKTVVPHHLELIAGKVLSSNPGSNRAP